MVLVKETAGARRSFKVANNRADYDRFIEYLKSLAGVVRVAFEPTADYHRPLAYRLITEGFEVRSVSSIALARLREARYGTWDKNDPKDAQVMLYMLEQGMVHSTTMRWPPEPTIFRNLQTRTFRSHWHGRACSIVC